MSVEDRERFNFDRFSRTRAYVIENNQFVKDTLLLKPRAVIVDTTAGTGTQTAPIKKRYTGIPGTIIGIDPNRVSLERARKRVRGDETTRVGFALGDARDLPLPSGMADFAYMGNSLHEIKGDQDKLKAAQELHRILSEDGAAFLNSAFTQESYPTKDDKDLKDPSETRVYGMMKLYAIEAISGARRSKSLPQFELKKANEYEDILRKAGFEDVTWKRRRVELSVSALEAISEYDEFIRGTFIDVRKEDGSEISLEEGSWALKRAVHRLRREYKEKHGKDAVFIFPRYWVEFIAKKKAK